MRALTLILALLLLASCGKLAAESEPPSEQPVEEQRQHFAQVFQEYYAGKRVVREERLYDFAFGMTDRLAGISYTGAASRLRLVLERMRQGHAVKVAAVGGSITWGEGTPCLCSSQTFAGHLVDWFNAAMPATRPWEEHDGGGGGAGNSSSTAGSSGSGGGVEGSSASGGGVEGSSDGSAAGAGAEEVPGRRARLLLLQQRRAHQGAAEGVRSSSSSSGARSGGAGRLGGELEGLGEAVLGGGEVGGKGGRPLQRAGRAVSAKRYEHVLFNGAVPGTASGYMSSCVEQHIPHDPQIVLIEYAINDPPDPDPFFKDPKRRAMERLIRKVLRLRSRPAVLLINSYSHLIGDNMYFRNAERDYFELASYYGLPSTSFKAATFPAMLVGASPMITTELLYAPDKIHMTIGGHILVAESLISLMMSLLSSNRRMATTAASTHLYPRKGAGGAAEVAGREGGARHARRLQDATTGGKGGRGGGGGGGGGHAGAGLVGGGRFGPRSASALAAATIEVVRELEQAASRRLPPPMAPGNWEMEGTSCYIEQQLQGLVVQPAEGWEWTDEGRRKWGWVAKEKDKELRIKVKTSLPGNRTEPIVLQVAHLESYQGMGRVRIECASGCACAPSELDAHNGERQVSITAMHDMQVTQHPECVLRLLTLGPGEGPGTTTDRYTGKKVPLREPAPGAKRGDKFKLMGIVVGEEPGAMTGGINWIRPESHDLAVVVQHEAH